MRTLRANYTMALAHGKVAEWWAMWKAQTKASPENLEDYRKEWERGNINLIIELPEVPK